VLAIGEFRRCGFTVDAPGPATRLTVAVKMPSTTHEVQWGKIETWLRSAGKPNEQAMKVRLRELLGSWLADFPAQPLSSIIEHLRFDAGKSARLREQRPKPGNEICAGGLFSVGRLHSFRRL
jgi:hypothetical protein